MTSTTNINWTFSLQSIPEQDGRIIRISDGDTSVYAICDNMDAAIKDYAETYSFNSPGDVRCRARLYADFDHAMDNDEIEAQAFTVRSEDGRRGHLVAI